MDVPEAEIDPVEEDKIGFGKTKIQLRGNPEKGEIVLKRDMRVRLVVPAQQISSIANWMLDALKAFQPFLIRPNQRQSIFPFMNILPI